MSITKFFHVKDRLTLLMIVCIVSNIVLAVFSADYLRKMESEANILYEQKLLLLHHIAQALESFHDDGIIQADIMAKIEAASYDSKTDYLNKQLKEQPTQQRLDEYQLYVLNSAQARITQYEKDVQLGYYLIFATSAMMVIIVLFLSISANRAINRPTEELLSLMENAKQGDFTKYSKNTSRDELGKLTTSYNRMVDELKLLFAVVKSSAQSVAQANDSTAQTSAELMQIAQQIAQQASSIAEATQSSTNELTDYSAQIQEISAGIALFTNHMETMRQYIEATTLHAQEGKVLMVANVVHMEDVQQTVQAAYATMTKLHTDAQQITQAVDIIENIAANTRLLALNASIEAARAGEHGKGFAVVAQEVSKLAVQSIQSTTTIHDVVKSIQHETAQTLQTMQKASDVVETGMSATNTTAQKFEQITTSIQTIEPFMADVMKTIKQIETNTKNVASISTSLTHSFENNAMDIAQIEQQIIAQQTNTYDLHEDITQIDKETRNLQQALARFRV